MPKKILYLMSLPGIKENIAYLAGHLSEEKSIYFIPFLLEKGEQSLVLTRKNNPAHFTFQEKIERDKFGLNLEFLSPIKFLFNSLKSFALGPGVFYRLGLYSEETAQQNPFFLPDNVTEIGKEAFLDSGLSGTFFIPKNCEQIEQNAFERCFKLTALNSGKDCKLKSIKKFAFFQCKRLETIDLSQTQLFNLEQYCFAECKKLQTIHLPSTLTYIDYHVFEGCEQMQTISGLEQVLTLYHNAFKNCKELGPELTLNSCVTLGDYVFHSCSKLKTLRFVDALTPQKEKDHYFPDVVYPDIRDGTFFKSSIEEIYLPKKSHYINSKKFLDIHEPRLLHQGIKVRFY